jgi:hypothetical protein
MPDGRSVSAFCRSHFSSGIATFHTDYIFRTDDEWDLLATGPFNSPKDGIYPLTGIMESNWLPYPFTMNWQVTRPGTIVFEKDEPFCFMFPIRKQAVLDCVPEIHDIAEDPELGRQHGAFATSRNEFMKRFHANDPEALRNPWLNTTSRAVTLTALSSTITSTSCAQRHRSTNVVQLRSNELGDRGSGRMSLGKRQSAQQNYCGAKPAQ